MTAVAVDASGALWVALGVGCSDAGRPVPAWAWRSDDGGGTWRPHPVATADGEEASAHIAGLFADRRCPGSLLRV